MFGQYSLNMEITSIESYTNTISQMRHLEPILAGVIDVQTTCLAHGDGID